MRYITFLFLLLSFSSAQSQRIVNEPDYARSTAPYVHITKVELHKDATRLYFTTTYDGDWIKIPAKTYIQPDGDSTKYFIQSAEGIEIDKQHKMDGNNRAVYILTFPAIHTKTATINYGEEGGTWFIDKVELTVKTAANTMPAELRGGWYNPKTGLADIAFYKHHAVYNNQLWDYKRVDINKKNMVQLTQGKTIKNFYLKKTGAGRILFGISAKTAKHYAKNVQVTTIQKIPAYQVNDVLKNDTAIYEGYIANYTPDNKIKQERYM